MLVDAITDVIQGVVLIAGLVVVFVLVVPHMSDGGAGASTSLGPRVQLLPATGESIWALIERWAIPIGGSVLATELVGRLLAARSALVARRSAMMAAALYIAIGSIPLVIGIFGPALVPSIADEEQLLPHIARTMLPTFAYAIFAGALISAILSTVDSTLLTSSSLLSHNVVVPVFRVVDERRKVLYARGGVVAFGIIAYVLALHASGVFALVEQASAFGSAGVLVSACFGMFTSFGGARAAVITLGVSPIVYLVAGALASETPFLLSLAAAFVAYVLAAALDRRASEGQ
jgi:solute:Na+ symporter, SSS family